MKFSALRCQKKNRHQPTRGSTQQRGSGQASLINFIYSLLIFLKCIYNNEVQHCAELPYGDGLVVTPTVLKAVKVVVCL